MTSPHRSRACLGRPFAPALRPLCALLAVLPFATFAQDASLQTITIKAPRVAVEPVGASSADADALQSGRAASSDTASLLRNLPGVSLFGAGGVSSLPSVHGLADDRLRIQVDGMDLISACGNHMNPPLSYIDPTRVDTVRLFAGVTPVSVGGDSIGATIQVNSPAPELAPRSVAPPPQADNYQAARDFKPAAPAPSNKPARWLGGDEVGSSSYQTRNHSLAYALRSDTHLVEMRLGLQDIPYQNYPTQRMDMTGNDSHQFNLRYQGQYDWGQLQARFYHEKTRHSMNFGEDKQFWYGPAGNVPGMPMDTEGKTTGLLVKGDVALSARDTLRAGAELQRYRLDDWWLPSGGGMAPNTFWNIRDGQRDRFDVYGEWEARWNQQWLSQVGLRSSHVRSNSGPVQGYNANYAMEANAFNAQSRKRSDSNIDVTALARYTPNANASYEFGFAHKTRSPNLYERYTWSTGGMAMRMINLVGDGNGYVGNMNLQPETANTLSATADWHDTTGERWGLKFTPYLTHVNNYIDARRCNGSGAMTACTGANQTATTGFVYLQFTNQDARLHGFDLSGFTDLGKTAHWGQFTLSGMLSYVQGKNRSTGDNLYNTIPLNARLALTQRLGAWTGSAELLMVSGKTRVSAVRNELSTAGYGLVNLRASYEWKQVRLDLGIDNLFDRFYHHPQGGAYVGQGMTMAATAVPWGVRVPGMGRSLNVGVTVKF